MTADVLGETLLKELARQLPADGLWRLDEPKLWWLTEKQRKAYTAIQNSSRYSSLAETEEKSLAASIDEILEGIHPSYSVVDLGCGNGKKAGLVLAAAKSHGQSPVYVPVDINPVYVATASKAASGYAPVIPLHADFMTLDLTKLGSDANLVLFLGNIYGDFPPKRILDYLHKNLRAEDLLVFSTQTSDSGVESIVKNYYNNYVGPWLWRMMAALGFSKEMASYRLRYDRRERAVECSYDVLGVPQQLRKIGMQPGDSILAVSTRKPSIESVLADVAPYFAVTFYSSEGSNQLIIAARRK